MTEIEELQKEIEKLKCENKRLEKELNKEQYQRQMFETTCQEHVKTIKLIYKAAWKCNPRSA